MTEQSINRRRWNPTVPPAMVLEKVAETTGIVVEDIIGKSRRANLVEARGIVSYLLMTDRASLNDIGSLMGGRHHTTIMNLIGKIESRIDLKDSVLCETISSLRRALQPSIPSDEKAQ